MSSGSTNPIIYKILDEQNQGHSTRVHLFERIEKILERPLITFFTSFKFPVMIDNADADMIEGLIQKMDLSKGFAILLDSPGGDGLAAERIINLSRSYSKTGEYTVLILGKAKSAATMISFGASKIYMSKAAELGPIDPQLTLKDDDTVKRFSVCNIVKSYEELFARAVKEKGNLEPYLQQLEKYDAREIEEFKAAIDLSADIAVRTLKQGIMSSETVANIKKMIKIFLTPERTKSHGRPIYYEEAESCGLNIEILKTDTELFNSFYELYLRSTNFVATQAAKCIESREHLSVMPV